MQQQASRVEVAARMVEEEREAKKRIPNYPGLERYKLLCKMGEYVKHCMHALLKKTRKVYVY